MLSKTGWKVLRAIGSETLKLKRMAEVLGRSLPWTSEIISSLVEGGFVEKKAVGNTHYVSMANRAHAYALQSLIIEVPGIHYEKLLHGKGILIAWTLLYEAKSVLEIASVSGVNQQIVRRYLRELRNRGWVTKHQGEYIFNKKLKLLWHFLDTYRNYSNTGARILWKFDQEVLFKTREIIDATPTGFTAYSKLGVRMYGINYTFFLPKRKLTVAEIAVHSLVQISGPRELALAIVLILKKGLTFNNLKQLAAKYDCKGRVTDLFTIIRSSDRRIITEHLPPITRSELDETLKKYEVKDVHSQRT